MTECGFDDFFYTPPLYKSAIAPFDPSINNDSKIKVHPHPHYFVLNFT